MKSKFYQIKDDLYINGRWHLGRITDERGVEFDPSEFTVARPLDLGPPMTLHLSKEARVDIVNGSLCVSVSHGGRLLEFTFAGFDVPVVTSSVARQLSSVAGGDIQLIPVKVGKSQEQYCIMNVVSLVQCIDIESSEIQWYEYGNDIRPDLAGEPEMITKLRINPEMVDGKQIFRPAGWDVVLIVSEKLKDFLEEQEISGILFEQVSGF